MMGPHTKVEKYICTPSRSNHQNLSTAWLPRRVGHEGSATVPVGFTDIVDFDCQATKASALSVIGRVVRFPFFSVRRGSGCVKLFSR